MGKAKRWLTAREYARETGRTEGAIRQAGCRGQINFKRVKGKVKYEWHTSAVEGDESLEALKARKLKVETDYRAERLEALKKQNFAEWSDKFLDCYFEAMQPVRKYFQDLQDDKINGMFEACFQDLSSRLKNMTV